MRRQLAIAALAGVCTIALTAQIAQAAKKIEPRWMVNNVVQEPGHPPVTFIGWGQSGMSLSKGGLYECPTVYGGHIEPPAKLVISEQSSYNCTEGAPEECRLSGGHPGVTFAPETTEGTLVQTTKEFVIEGLKVDRQQYKCQVLTESPTEGSVSGGEQERTERELFFPGAFYCGGPGSGTERPKVTDGVSVERQTRLGFNENGDINCGPWVGSAVGSMKITGLNGELISATTIEVEE